MQHGIRLRTSLTIFSNDQGIDISRYVNLTNSFTLVIVPIQGLYIGFERKGVLYKDIVLD